MLFRSLRLPPTNLSVVYLLVIVILAQGASQRTLVRAALILVALTFLGLLVKAQFESQEWRSLIAFRLFNRTMVTVGIIAISAMGISMARLRLRMARSIAASTDPAGADEEFANLCTSLERLRWALRGALLLVLILAVDLLTPAPFNLPILYVIPVLICARSQSSTVIWGAAAGALAGTVLGYWIGPELWPQVSPLYLTLNRVLACAVIFTVAFILGLRLRWSRRRMMSIAAERGAEQSNTPARSRA